MSRRALFLLLFLASPATSAIAGPISRERIPEPLKPWVGWALHGHEEELCPFLSGSGETQCLWPGRLTLDLGEREGKFTQTWTVDAEGTVPLPGEERRWPQEIQVDGKPAAALESDGAPVLLLSMGTHTVSGSFHWDSLPESLAVPAETGLLGLTLRGAAVPFPARDAGGRLFLQRRAQVAHAEADRLEVAVTRRVVDEVPLRVETRVELSVSGRAREVVLASPLLPGFVPLALAGPLPARLEPDGHLRVQVRPGAWTVEVTARSTGPVTALSLSAPQGPWAGEEVWVFAARPSLRLVEVGGVPAIDPQQTRLPEEWKKLPAFRLRPGETLKLAERRRGDRPPAPDHLDLQRALWLDFAGTGYTFRDKVDGVLHGSWRLEMTPPARLGRVALDGRDQVITRRPGSETTGIETRLGQLHLVAEGRIEGTGGSAVAVGWDHDFAKVSGVLHLPPGWTLLAATGVDHAPGTWVGRWSLLDLFLVLIAALAVRQLWGTRWGAVALSTLVLTWQEPEAPQWLWLAVLATAALLRLLKEGWLRSLVRLLSLLAAAALVLVAVAFLVRELRQGLFPTLEHPEVAVGEPGAAPAPEDEGFSFVAHKRVAVADEEEAQPVAAPASPSPAAAPVPEREQKEYLSSLRSMGMPKVLPKPAPPPRALQEIDPTAVATTGPGLPRWRWNRVDLTWNGPVEKTERLHLFLLPPAANLVLALLRVALLALLLLRLLPLPQGLPPLRRWVAAALLLFALLPSPARAQGSSAIPPQPLLDELRDRLIAPLDCHPDCAAASRLFLDFTPGALTARLEVAAANVPNGVGVPLPGGAQQWVPAQVSVDGKPAGVTRDGAGRLWVSVGPGRHEILLAGPLPTRETVALPLPGKPHRVTASGTGWTVSGLHEDGVPDDSLQLNRVSAGGGTAGATGGAPGSSLAPATLPPFLLVERTLHLGLTWQVESRVLRQSPPGIPAAVEVPLLPGESVTSPGVRVEKGRVLVSLGPQGDDFAWTSALAERPRLVLEAPRTLAWTEVWKLDASPVWHVDFSGIPDIAGVAPTAEDTGDTGARVPEWRPWPGERLELAISRPAGVPGASLTIDGSRLTVAPGARTTASTLDVDFRSSRGGEQTITLPPGAILETVTLGGAAQPLRQEGDKVTLSFAPGAQKAGITWREPRGVSLLFRAPRLDLGARSVNALTVLHLSPDRWVLLVGGPRLGPAVLFWGLFLTLLVVAAGLARTGLTPLRFRDWVLLGLGLSQIPLAAAGVVAAWLLVLGWRRNQKPEARRPAVFDLLQLLLVGWTAVALGFLFWAIQQGLLGSPEMQIAGNASTAFELRWFADRAGRILPTTWVFSVPVFVYRLAMLAWALWLALALLRWLRWGWESLIAGGGWRPLRRPRPAPAPVPPPALAPVKEETP